MNALTRKSILAPLAAAFLTVGASLQARTWTSTDGSKTFEAELEAYDAESGKVTVRLLNGKSMTFLQEKLSEADITFLKENGNKVGGAKPSSSGEIGELPDELPDPDGEEADMSKPVQVYILLGQSDMLGFGKPANLKGIAAEKYPYLVDDSGEWTVRKDVRNVFVMCSGNNPAKDQQNDWMTIQRNIGPEIGIGHHLGEATDAPVLVLKSCIGNRALACARSRHRH